MQCAFMNLLNEFRTCIINKRNHERVEEMKQELKTVLAKRKISDVSLKLFQDKGFDKTSIQDICKASGYSVGAFYHHYSSKADILDDGYYQFDIELEEEFEHLEFSSTTDAIYALIIEQTLRIVKLGVQLTTSLFKEQLSFGKKYIVNKERFELRTLERLLTEGKDSGEFLSSMNEKEIANSIFRISVGDIYVWCLNEGKTDLIEMVLSDLDRTMKGIKKDN